MKRLMVTGIIEIGLGGSQLERTDRQKWVHWSDLNQSSYLEMNLSYKQPIEFPRNMSLGFNNLDSQILLQNVLGLSVSRVNLTLLDLILKGASCFLALSKKLFKKGYIIK